MNGQEYTIPSRYGDIHCELIVPYEEFQQNSEIVWAKIRADMETHMDALLKSFEEMYGFEPVYCSEALPFLNFENVIEIKPNRQLEMFGYKIYKKKR